MIDLPGMIVARCSGHADIFPATQRQAFQKRASSRGIRNFEHVPIFVDSYGFVRALPLECLPLSLASIDFGLELCKRSKNLRAARFLQVSQKYAACILFLCAIPSTFLRSCAITFTICCLKISRQTLQRCTCVMKPRMQTRNTLGVSIKFTPACTLPLFWEAPAGVSDSGHPAFR